MMSKISKFVLVSVALVLGACAPMKSSQTANSATRGHANCVQTSRGIECNKDAVKAFDDCMRYNTQTMGTSGAFAVCDCVSNGGSMIPSQNPAIPPTCAPAPGGNGMVGGGMPGMMPGATTMMPGRYSGYPGSAVIMYPDPTPQGVIAMENSGSGGRVVTVPGSGGAQPASSGGATQQDVEDLARSQAAQQAAICRARPRDPLCCTNCKK